MHLWLVHMSPRSSLFFQNDVFLFSNFFQLQPALQNVFIRICCCIIISQSVCHFHSFSPQSNNCRQGLSLEWSLLCGRHSNGKLLAMPTNISDWQWESLQLIEISQHTLGRKKFNSTSSQLPKIGYKNMHLRLVHTSGKHCLIFLEMMHFQF